MPDIDRLIEAWEIFRDSNPYEICNGREFRAIREPEYCMGQMIEDTIALLKEQKARVLTLDEAAEDQEVWTEAKLRGTERIPLFISILWLTDDAKDFELELIGTGRRAFMLAKEYGKTWRCWSSKPTDEQREAAKW